VHRDALVAALWPDTGPDRPTNALNSTLTRLRKTLRAINPGLAALVQHADGRYQLHHELVSVDYWDFLVAATDITHTDPAIRRGACEAVVSTYQGPLAAEHTGEWLITLREAARRRYLDTVTTLARLTIADDPDRTLGLLETARNLDPLNEAIYRDIIRIQYRLGRPDAAAITLQLLRAQLADIDATPSPSTVALTQRLGEVASSG
jgi:DNA-binding SARP family transcriptional activator